MAQEVTAHGRAISTIDADLAYLERHWRWVGDVVRAWQTLPAEERLDFAVEWPVSETRLEELQRHVDRGTLGPEQRARYAALHVRVAQERPSAERLIRTVMPAGWV